MNAGTRDGLPAGRAARSFAVVLGWYAAAVVGYVLWIWSLPSTDADGGFGGDAIVRF